jgi:xylulokinase
MPHPRVDPAGCGHVFGNPLGGFMSLACVRNGSLAREAFRDRLGASWADFEQAAFVSLPADARTEPFLFDEITPRRAAGFSESRPDLSTPQRIRAFLEGQAGNLRAQLDWMGLEPGLLLLTGGASKNDGICTVFSQVFGCPVRRFELSDSAALGAARLAWQDAARST